ncbi:hypothetical protein QJ856_gp0403 [Tupanvirus deep ocean]|uniref:Uncharacterized protein n=1 Tax=Tupanvirus soda lake TaxID=2126985 RepID=A0AC59HC85_9VIRU|nr:hypothetical protein QJ856_gp0403 [Tupanvirus deep ocean]AUL79706.2 hypothetical protein [Tupanvirus deep ocean]
MFYFIHATNFDNFKSILKSKHIYAPYYSPFKIKGMSAEAKSKFVFTNIFTDGLTLREDEKAGIGEITFIIDPLILKYKVCYVNPYGWYGYIYDKTIIMNKNVDLVLDLVKQNYRYPLVTSNEALFRKSISTKFIIGVICEPDLEQSVRELLNEHGYEHVKIFNKFPILLS